MTKVGLFICVISLNITEVGLLIGSLYITEVGLLWLFLCIYNRCRFTLKQGKTKINTQQGKLHTWSSQYVGVLYTRIVTELVGSVIYFGLPSV